MPPVRRRLIVAVVAVVVVVAGIVGAMWGLSARRSQRPPATIYSTDAAAGRALARDACEELDRFVAAIDRDDSAEQALAVIDRFERAAVRAYDSDVVWLRLVSAAKALRSGVRSDDANAAKAGIDLGRSECAKAAEPGRR